MLRVGMPLHRSAVLLRQVNAKMGRRAPRGAFRRSPSERESDCRMYRKLIFFALFVFVLVACSGVPVATVTPSIVLEETAVPIAVIEGEETTDHERQTTDEPTVTMAVTEPPTAISPTETLPPPPSVAPTDTPIPAEPTATPTAEFVLNAPRGLFLSEPEDFIPARRNPLTGDIVEDFTMLQRRPILCKISNSPPEWVRPQSGLNSADIIFEHYAEGVITRFSALFYGSTPEKVGPIRSARLIDLELPLMYDAGLCFSGGSTGQGPNRGVGQLVYDTSFANRVMRTDWPGYYRTGENKPFEHTFYNELSVAWDHLDQIGLNQAPEYVTNMTFGSEVPPISAPASYIRIRYGNGKGTFVEWNYDEASGQYLRTADGTPVIDANDGEQVSVSNVIIIKAPHIINENICETQGETRCLAFSTELQIWGSGFASVFRDGRQINGSWQREDRYANGMMFTFYDDAGNVIPLQIGQTWIQFVPYEYLVTPIDVEG